MADITIYSVEQSNTRRGRRRCWIYLRIYFIWTVDDKILLFDMLEVFVQIVPIIVA